MNHPDPVAVEPKPEVDERTAALLGQLARLGFMPRLLVAALMGSVATLLVLATGIVWRFDDWRAWVFIGVILEPLTLFVVLGAAYCLVPSSAFGRWFAMALPRARWVVILVLSVIAVAVVIGLGGTAWALFRRFQAG